MANNAIEFLENYSGERPFFLAVGFHLPHLPFIFPSEFIKYYPLENVPLPKNPYAPMDMPDIAWNNYCEETIICEFTDLFYLNLTGEINTTIDVLTMRNLRRTYFTSISYIDHLVGRVVDKLEELGLADNTVISFLGDHGWQLGEHGAWCKQTNFELATHAPMMLHIPGKTDDGITTDKLVEMVDLFPTKVEAAGLPSIPLCPEENSTDAILCREGTSLMPLIANTSAPWKTVAFSQFPRTAQNGDTVMGYTMRTDRYRYTEWAKFIGDPVFAPDWSVLYGAELYDHKYDPEENINRANYELYTNVRMELSTVLHNGWRNVPVE